jgi:hypothetical protein
VTGAGRVGSTRSGSKTTSAWLASVTTEANTALRINPEVRPAMRRVRSMVCEPSGGGTLVSRLSRFKCLLTLAVWHVPLEGQDTES